MPLAMPPDEARRIETLHRYGILDTPPEPVFDQITTLTTELLRAPMAGIAFVGRQRTWLKSRHGFGTREVTREESIAAHTILQDAPLAVDDAQSDVRFTAHPMVSGDPQVRAYAGAPLKTHDGVRLGTLCVMDTQPRQFAPEELRVLERLAALVIEQLEVRSQQQVRAAETAWELYATAFGSIALGVAIVDESGLFVDVNPAYSELCGYGRAELVGRHFAMLLFEDQREEVCNLHARYIGTDEHIVKECRLRRKDGSSVAIQFTGAPFVTASGRRFRISTVTDVSSWKPLEEQFRGDEKMDAISRLAGGAAHGFNNLLTIITGYSQLVRSSLPESAPVTGYVDEISKAADRAATLTNKLLALSRRRIGDHEYFDVNGLLRECVAVFRESLRKPVTVRMDLAPELDRLLADRSYLSEAVFDLLANARDAVAAEGVVTVRSRMSEERGGSLPPGRYIQIEVEDNGCGIDAEMQRHLFEPFFTTKGVGKGIGLATVYGTVKQFGGDIRVDSAPGRGTLVTLFLPVAS